MSGIVIAATPSAHPQADALRELLSGSFTQINLLPDSTDDAIYAVRNADLLLVIINPGWESQILDAPAPYAAIEQALTLGKLPVLNVLLDETVTLPNVTALPAEIRGIVYMSQYKLQSDEAYRPSVAELAREIAEILQETSTNFNSQVSSPTAKAQAKKQRNGIPFNLIMIIVIVTFGLLLIIAPQVEENASSFLPPTEDPNAVSEATTTNADLLIGFGGGLSGGVATRGEAMLNGVQLALQERPTITLNTSHTVDLLVQDTACSAVQGRRVAELFASSSNIAGVIGHLCNTSCSTAQTVYTEAGLPVISPACNAPELTRDTNHTFNRIVPATTAEASAAADYLNSYNVALVYDEQPHTGPFAEAFLATYTGDLSLDYGTESTTIDYDNIVDAILDSDANAVYFIGRATNAGEIRQRLAEAESDLVFVASVLGDAATFAEAAGDAADGTIMIQITSPQSDAFNALYEATYAIAPESAVAAYAYDATNMLLDAIESTATEDAEGVIQLDYAALNAAIRAYNGDGVTGVLQCDANGDCAQAATAVFVVQSGQLEPVDE